VSVSAGETWRNSLRDGVRASSPLIIGVLPFALIAGITARTVGFDALQSVAMSLFVFAGASQLAAEQLYAAGAPILVAVLTVGVVNLRFMIYSASLAPYFRSLSTRRRMGLAAVLVDQAYAVSILRFDTPGGPSHKAAFYLGSVLPLWIVWQSGSALGYFVGAAIPREWGLEFTIPLSFLALLVPSIKDRSSLVAAMFAAIVVVIGSPLPYNLGLPLAAFSGIAAGMIAEAKP
jgi:4-azaleucine resistance transporter AzlC